MEPGNSGHAYVISSGLAGFWPDKDA